MRLSGFVATLALVAGLALTGCSSNDNNDEHTPHFDNSRTPTAADLDAATAYLVQHQNDPLAVPADTKLEEWQVGIVVGRHRQYRKLDGGRTSIADKVITDVILADGTIIKLHGVRWLNGTRALDGPISNSGTLIAYYKPHAGGDGPSLYDLIEIKQDAAHIEGVHGTGVVNGNKF